MPLWAWIVIAIAIVVVLALVGWAAARRRRTATLRDRFGNEYDRVVQERGDRRAAEQELAARRAHRESLDIHPLTSSAQREYADRWKTTQATFVDSPSLAVTEADVLVQSVMRDRGYPISDAKERMADVSVDHPEVMDHFRSAGRIAGRARDGQATTEDLRQAMVHYRELFARLLTDDESPARRSA